MRFSSLLTFGALAVSSSAHALLIDGFERGTLDLSVIQGANAGGTYPGVDAVGGFRALSIGYSNSGGGAAATRNGATGSLDFSTTGTNALSLAYGRRFNGNGTFDYATQPLGLDFRAATALRITVDATTGTSLDVSLTSNKGGTLAFLNSPTRGFAGAGVYDIPLSSFVNPNGTARPLDLSQVDGLAFVFFTPNRATLKIGSIEALGAVPEPAPMLVLAAGALGILRRRRA